MMKSAWEETRTIIMLRGDMTREELHERVWCQPMTVLAKSMGISDVALAKRCKAASVPVPPRGWWARKEAGKAVKIEPLPPLPFALDNYFPAIERSAAVPSQGAQSEDTISTEPIFRDIALVSDEIKAAVRSVKVPAALINPHPIVARLLQQDEKRKEASSARSYYSDYYGPKFTKPIQQRRLRILSSIFHELERLGCKPSGSTHAGEKFNVRVGHCWAYVCFGVEGGTSGSYFRNERRGHKPPDRELLRFDIVEHDERSPPKRVWREDEVPLERQVADIVCGLLLQAEKDTREGALWHYKWACEDRERRIREARLAAEKAEADRIAREKAAAAARVAALLNGADALERAARIRRYVSAIQAACMLNPQLGPADALERWVYWALAEADAIDPVSSGRFMSDLVP